MALDRDGLPENAVEVTAKGLCQAAAAGDDRLGCDCKRGGNCYAEDIYGTSALGAVAALRVAIREIHGRMPKQ